MALDLIPFGVFPYHPPRLRLLARRPHVPGRVEVEARAVEPAIAVGREAVDRVA